MKSHNILNKTPRYLSFVISCWQERAIHTGREIVVWRFSLQDPHTNRRRGFATLESLLVSLQAELTDADEGV